MSNVIDKAVDFAVNVANDNSHGYDQIHRWLNPDVDCSSLVILSYENAGVPVKEAGATYTGNMKNAFVKCGFEAIPYKKPMGLMKGDVILNEKHHTCMYIGGGKIVQASIGDKGTIGNKGGDQTGREVLVCNFYEYSKGWDYVLRYKEQEDINTVNVEMRVLRQGDKGEQVKTLQRLLKELGYKGKPVNGVQKDLTIDGDYGSNTAYSVGQLQTTMKNKGIIQNVDYIVGSYTWNYLLKGC